MKLILALFVSLSLSLIADDAPNPPKELGTITVGDKTYANVHVTSVTDLGVKAMWDGGLGLIRFDEMSPDLQKKFGYDPQKFNQAANAQAAHDAASDKEESAQAKVDQSKLEKADKDAASQATAAEVAKGKPVQGVKWLAGSIQGSVTGGYAVYIEPFVQPKVSYMQSIGGGGGGYRGPVNPYPAIGYDMTVILKTDAMHTVGETISIPVMEDGVFTDESNNHYKAIRASGGREIGQQSR